MKHKDYAGNPIFEFVDSQGLTRFIPYDIGTINEYIKAKIEMKEEKQTENKSGAV